ncbi:uncharacterized protein E0L32_003282 [Thyridium curvatum]|uniref:Uncharacterized protein n=1 Tax=Thyridium curvatum TaxID=1093900 RepID=A0A507BEG5_9PEZI|nr:uncharacterized protein E0L32_003282 [Thyridium curvatum]TPX17164.1 hypothetical protein E0L32_003282 [Thyridium curvatum]
MSTRQRGEEQQEAQLPAGSSAANGAGLSTSSPAPAKPSTPPKSPKQHERRPSSSAPGSRTSLDSTDARSTLSQSRKKEYMDSLVVPSSEEMQRIAEVQRSREVEHKRQRSRDAQLKVSAAASGAASVSASASASAPVVASTRVGGQNRHGRHGSLSSLLRLPKGNMSDDEQGVRQKAASLIQRTYRGYRVRREMKGLGVNATTRWTHALREAQFREMTRPRARSELGEGGVVSVLSRPSLEGEGGPASDSPSRSSTAARQNWKKAAIIAKRATTDENSSSDSDSNSESSDTTGSEASEHKAEMKKLRQEAREKRKKDSKMMGLQYFLEMVDLKHRYGSNLRTYHEEWKRADTHENFFYWLDYGEGRNVDIEACPRERLDREQVRYLSREERQYYLVKVDEDGRLCWSKNGARIDTTEQWKDSIHGIVPADDPTPAFQSYSTNETRLLGDTSSGESDSEDEDEASESELEAARAAKYANPGMDQAKGVKKVKHVSASTIFNKLLRKSVKKNTWIFVADTSFRLYVGIKNSGAFQHSSFLQGSRISAAGLIKIKNGRLTSLSPLSGHYRPPASNFRAFVKSLKEEGVDMSHVSISKSYAVLVGLEAYVKSRRKGKDLVRKITHRRDKIIAPEEVKRREEEEMDKSESAAKEREFLEEERKREEKEREENRLGVQVLQKLRVTPREPEGQKGSEEATYK